MPLIVILIENAKHCYVQSSVSTGQDVPRDVPGQRIFLVPVSLCPGTRTGAKIPGQTPLSQDKMNFNLSNCTKFFSEIMF